MVHIKSLYLLSTQYLGVYKMKKFTYGIRTMYHLVTSNWWSDLGKKPPGAHLLPSALCTYVQIFYLVFYWYFTRYQ